MSRVAVRSAFTLPFVSPQPSFIYTVTSSLSPHSTDKDVTNTHRVVVNKLPIHQLNLNIDDPGAAEPDSWARCAACLHRLPRGLACAPRVLSALPARSPCPPLCGLHALSSLHYSTRHHLPTQRVGTPAPDPSVRPCTRRLRHADERDPHVRPRRPCSHLRRARSDQDDQPARQAGQSHAGAHDGHRTLSP